jgi:hypothetical protein
VITRPLDGAGAHAVLLTYKPCLPTDVLLFLLAFFLCNLNAGGIKLHFELSLLLGSAAGAALNAAAAFYTAAWPHIGHLALAAVTAAAALGGAVAGCMVAADVLLLLLWPLAAAFVAAASLHKFQLRCLAATWRLIRGKEKVWSPGRPEGYGLCAAAVALHSA